MRKLQLPPPPWKKSPPLSRQLSSKSWGPIKLPFFENLVGGSTPQQKGEGGGVHTMLWGTTTKSRLPPWLQILGTTHSPIISNQYLHPIRNELKRLKWSLHILITDRQYQLNFCREKNSDFSCLENWICFL